jgi:hypothetical protein
MSLTLFPAAAFDLIDDAEADRLLAKWGHWLGGCNRPFGRHSFGVALEGRVVSVAVSTSTINRRCGGYNRGEVVELARQASSPDYAWATRVCVRLWRELAPQCWANEYWPVRAVVSYANALRHAGNIYRFDGWTKVADVKGGVSGSTSWQKDKTYDPKTVWAYEFDHIIQGNRAA